VRQEIRAGESCRPRRLRRDQSPLILQPGPAALTDGLDALSAIVANWAAQPE
jgi:iron complex transport system substrate-binding protein